MPSTICIIATASVAAYPPVALARQPRLSLGRPTSSAPHTQAYPAFSGYHDSNEVDPCTQASPDPGPQAVGSQSALLCPH
ncbi:hypothetical protein C8Q73DRAFT_27535 [Cubamyces lactineus]|nr:hypothetical protein C8Q73DRAFT_27535 [Cubamyces lactineus]